MSITRSAPVQIAASQNTFVPTPKAIGAVTSWTKISIGFNHTLALKSDGSLWGWGNNQYGQLTSSVVATTASSPIALGTNIWSAISAGNNFSMAIDSSNLLWAWGDNTYGQLGTTPYAGTNLWSTGALGLNAISMLRKDNTIWTWGLNTSGQLGDGTTVTKSSPVQILSDKNISKVFRGDTAAFAIDSASRLWAWGNNAQGQLGDGTTISKSSPVQIPGSWLTVGVGFTHVVGIRTDYTMWSWGNGSAYGLLGDNATTTRSSPVQIGTGGTSYVMVAAGYSQNYVIDSLGKMYGWGSSVTYGAVGDGTTISRSSPTQIGTTSSWTMVSSQISGGIALDILGKVYAWGLNASGQSGLNDNISRSSVTLVTPLSGSFVSVAAGASNGMALKTDGTLWVWGGNGNGQIGDSTTVNRSSPVQLASSVSGATLIQNPGSLGGILGYVYNNALTLNALTNAGTSPLFMYVGPLSTSGISQSSPVQISTNYVLSPIQVGTSSWLNVSAGGGHVLAIRSDSTLWNWGLGLSGQTSSNAVPNYFSKSSPVQVAGSYISISAGGSHSTAINTDGQLFTWGDNTVGQLGVNKSAVTYSWIQIAGNSTHTLAIRNDYTLWGWGRNNNGQLGDGTTVIRSSPVQIGADSWIFISSNEVGDTQGGQAGIKADGTLWTWGLGTAGQLGDGNTISRSSPVQVAGGGSWAFVAASTSHMVAIKGGAQAGQVFAWGYNLYGQLGDNSTVNKSSPVQILSTGSSYTFVASGNLTSYAIRLDGTVWSWGYNGNGELGDNGSTTVHRSSPVQVSTLGTRVLTKVYAFGSASAWAVQNNNKLWAWGLNTTGQLGDGTTVTRSSPVQVAGAFNWSMLGGNAGAVTTMGLGTNGAVYAWGTYRTNTQTGSTSNATYFSWAQISVGPSHTVALREDGKVFAWGRNDTGQLGDNTTVNKSSPVQVAGTGDEREYFTSVTAGSNYSVAVNVLGKLYSWGTNPYGQLGHNDTVSRSSPTQLSTTVSSFVSVAAGDNHTIAITTASTVFVWGANNTGQLGVNDTVFRSSPYQIPSMSNIKQVDAGGSFSVALDTAGKLYTWGVNDNGQLGYGYDPVKFITGNGQSNITILTTNGYLYGAGTNNYGQLGDGTITARSSFVAVAAGVGKTWSSVVMSTYFTLALANDGTLWAWGDNGAGQLGQSTTTASYTPLQIGSLNNWRTISASGGTAYAINSSGGLYAWGYNADGQLGTNSTASLSSPVQVRADLSWSDVVAFENYLNVVTYGNTVVLAKTTTGSIFSWGYNTTGEVGDGTTVTRSSPVQIGMGYSWASIGIKHAIRSDGTLWGWGNNQYGTIGDLTAVNKSSPVQIGTFAWDKYYGGVENFNAGLSPYCCVFAIRNDGTLWGWGNGAIFGFLGDNTTVAKQSPTQIGLQTDTTKFKAVFNLGTHIYALSGNDNLWVWGNAATAGINIMGTGDTVARSSPAMLANIVSQTATLSNMLSISTFYQYNATSSPVQVGSSSWTMVSAGLKSISAIDINGRLFAWGDNTYGQLGTFLSNATTTPSTGNNVGGFIRNDGKAILTGYNDYGQLGDNTTINKSNPIQLLTYSPTTWKYINRALFRDTGGTTLAIDAKYNVLYGWGYNGAGNLGDGTTISRSSPVNLGALLPGGGAGWSKAIGALSYSVGIRADGTIWGWGVGSSGQLGYLSWRQIKVGATNAFSIRSDGALFAWGYGTALGDNTTVSKSSPVQIGNNVAWKDVFISNHETSSLAFVMATRYDGSLWGWGYNGNGQLGDSTIVSKSSPVLVTATAAFSWVAVGLSSTAAIDLFGRMWTWGTGASGELGDGTTAIRSVPALISAENSWATVTGGRNFIVATKTDGTIWSWGLNSSGQLGDNTTVNKSSPVTLTGGGSWLQVSAGYSHAVGIKSGGSLWAWGNNALGQLGQRMDTYNKSSPVQIASSTLINSVYFSGSGSYIQVTPDPTSFNFGTSDFTFEVWGYLNIARTSISSYYVLYDTNASLDATGVGRMLILVTTTGTLQLQTLTGTVVASSATGAVMSFIWNHIAISRISGSTRIFINGVQSGSTASDSTNYVAGTVGRPLIGINAYNSTATPWNGYMSNLRVIKGQGLFSGTFTPATSNLTTSTVGATGAGAAGSITGSVVLLTLQSNTIIDNSPAGYNLSPASVIATTPPIDALVPFTQTLIYESWTSVTAGGNTNLAIKTIDNGVYGWGDNSNFQLLTQPLFSSWFMLGGRLGIKTDGTLWSWGPNQYGELGLGDTLDRSSPTQVGTDTDWIWCGDYGGAISVSAVKRDGRGYVWGAGTNNVLGLNDPTIAYRSSPVQLPGSWVQISLGFTNSMGLKTDGTVWTWGDSQPMLGQNTTPGTGQVSSPVQIASTFSFVQISMGGNAAFAIKTDSTLWAWGYGTYTGDGTSINRSSPVQIGTSSWSMVFSSYQNASAIDVLGRLYTWGSASGGQLGNGTTNTGRSAPTQILTTSSFTMVAGRDDRYGATLDSAWVAKTTAGAYYGWGLNTYGQLGDSTTVNKSTPALVFAAANSTVGTVGVGPNGIRIGVGGSFARLFSTGRNDRGGVGDNTTVNRSAPVQISLEQSAIISPTMVFAKGVPGTNATFSAFNTSSFVAIAVSQSNSAVISSNANTIGTLWNWGSNTYGQLADSTVVARSSPVQIAAGTIGVTPLGATSSPVQIASGSWSQVAIANSTVYGIKTDGSLWSWGFNTNGQMGIGGVTQMSSPVQINSGELTDPNAYSMVFSGGYLEYAISSGFAFGTGDFTIELWAYPLVLPNTAYNPIFTVGTNSSGQEIRIGQNVLSAGLGYFIPNNSNNSNVYAGFGHLPLFTWSHIALVRYGSTVSFYRNGVCLNSTTGVSFNFTNTTRLRIAGSQPTYADGTFNGYISNVRVIKGQSIFTGNVPNTTYFTPSTSPLTTSTVGATGSGAAGSLTGTVVLLTLRNNMFANTFVDESTNAWPITYFGGKLSSFTPFTSLITNYSFTNVAANQDAAIAVTSTGKLFSWGTSGYGSIGDNTNAINRSDPVQVAIGSPSGSLAYSVYFSKVGVNYLYSPVDSGSTLGTSDHTIEFYIRLYSANANGMVWQYERNAAANATNKYYMTIGSTTSALYLGNGTGYGITITSTSNAIYTLVTNYWTHVAVVRSGNTFTWYVNGVSIGSGTYAANIPAQSTYGWQIGSDDSSINVVGQISNFRVVVGQALYTGNFKPSTAPLTTSTVGATGSGAAGTLIGSVPLLALNSSNTFNNSGTGPQLLKSLTGYEPIADYVNVPFSQNTFPFTIPNYTYSSISQITSGNYHYAAITTAGALYTWGYNGYWQMADRSNVNRSFPTQITSYSSSPSTYSVRIFNANDWIRLPTTAASATGIGIGLAGYKITFEMFVYPFYLEGVSYGLINCNWGGASGGRWLFGMTGGVSGGNCANLFFRWTTAAADTTVTTTSYLVKIAQWNHVAVTIDATTSTSATIKFFVNGTATDTFSGQNMSAQTTHSSPIYLFTQPTGYTTFYGYASNARITRDVLVYTGNYTVPTSSLGNSQSAGTNISAITLGQVGLLTLQNATAIDNSFNNYTLTTNTAAAPNELVLGISDIVPFTTGSLVSNSYTQVYSNNNGLTVVNGADGTFWGWGRNSTGELGVNTTVDYYSPVQVTADSYIYQPKLSSPTQVMSGTSFNTVNTKGWATGAVASTGYVLWMWGRNDAGQLSTNDTVARSSPTQITQTVSYVALSVGVSVVTGLGTLSGSNGLMYGWGSGVRGQLGDSTTVDKSSPIQINSGTMNPVLYPKLINSSNWAGSFTMVQSNQYNATAIGVNSLLYAWGNNTVVGLGRPGTTDGIYSSPVLVGTRTPTVSASPVQISGSWSSVSAGYRHTLGINSSGNMYIWGSEPATGVYWKHLASTDASLYGIKSDGSLWACGFSSATDPRLGDGTTIARSNPVQIPGSWSFVVGSNQGAAAIRSDGTLWTWGGNAQGALGDGTVVTKSSPVQVSGGGSWITVAGGRQHYIGIKVDGSLWGWGSGNNGQLGMGYAGAAAYRSTPTQILINTVAGTDVATLPFPSTWKKVACGDYSSYAVSDTGDLWVWGYNLDGQLGLNDTVDRSNPVQVMAGSGIIEITGGGMTSSATHIIKADGTLWGWGLNTTGQLGLGDTVSRSSPVQIGTSRWLSISSYGNINRFAMRSDNTIWAWGQNNYGQLMDGSVLNQSSPVQVAASWILPSTTPRAKWQVVSTSSTTANSNWYVSTTGELYAVGQNRYGELGLGTYNQAYSYATFGATFVDSVSGQSSPTQIGSAGVWTTVNGGNDYSVATNNTNALYAWGLNTNYQIGNNSGATLISSPTQIGTDINLAVAGFLGGYLPQ